MVKFRPTVSFCGCLPLVVGVNIIAFLELVNCVLIIGVTSSKEPLEVSGITLSSIAQVLAGAWAFVGIPIIIGAGVGALYRVEWHLRVFFAYLAASLVMLSLWCVTLFVGGKICGTVAPSEAQRLGSAFVCGFVDMASLFWVLMLIVIRLYAMFVVWSAAEEVRLTDFPELMRYTETLRSIKEPEEPTPPGGHFAGLSHNYAFNAEPATKVVVPPAMESYGAMPQRQAPPQMPPPIRQSAVYLQMPPTAPPPTAPQFAPQPPIQSMQGRQVVGGPPSPHYVMVQGTSPRYFQGQQWAMPGSDASSGSSSSSSSRGVPQSFAPAGVPQSFAPAPPSGFS